MVSCSSHCKFHWCLSFAMGMMKVMKWFGIRNTVTIINTSVCKVAKQLPGAISLLNSIRGQGTVDVSESLKEYTFNIKFIWHETLILIIYEVIILIAIVLVVRLQMPDRYVK